jgi:hypothetical protein
VLSAKSAERFSFQLERERKTHDGSAMLDQHQLIANLEAEIDDLRDSAERCRKIDMGAKAAMGVGVALLLVSFFWFSASALVIGIAAVLGSVALVGSNRGTLGEIITGIRLAEARRAEVIDGLQLETISPEDDPGDL